MAQSFLSTLPLSVRQAYPIIRSAVKEGLASRSIQSLLTRRGLGIRRQTLLDVMRLEKEKLTSSLAFRILGEDRLPRIKDFPFAPHRVRRRFNYLFEVPVFEKDDWKTRKIVVASPDVLTIAQAREEVVDMLESGVDAYKDIAEYEEPVISEAWQAGRKGLI